MSDHSGPEAGVPYLSLQQEFDRLRQPWFDALAETGASGAFVLGPNVRAFEQEAADYVGAAFGVAVANGTDALLLSLRALDIGPGDEVITSPFTFFATAEAISMVGATPVFVDIDERSFNLRPDQIESRITSRTRAILPVHIFGNPAEMEAIDAIAASRGLYLVEDAAQAFGARWGQRTLGSIGAAGCFSFYPTKVLGGYGDGGLITTSDEAMRERLLKLRNHGACAPFMHDELGYNSRLDEVQAALLRLKLARIEQAVDARCQVADWYDHYLQGMDLVTPLRPAGGRHAFNLYTIRHPRRDALRDLLNRHKVGNSQCYPQGLHLQPVYSHLGYSPGDLPVVDRICEETLSLPIYPGLEERQVAYVCRLIAKV